eukprot:1402348-Amphidinium_carterae.1
MFLVKLLFLSVLAMRGPQLFFGSFGYVVLPSYSFFSEQLSAGRCLVTVLLHRAWEKGVALS